jgi:predicted RNA-binding protein YlxR (DUF448 family)
LVRIVRTPDGVYVDETGKVSGRGAYLHADLSCWEAGMKRSLEKALKTNFSDQDRDRLLTFQLTINGKKENPDHENELNDSA